MAAGWKRGQGGPDREQLEAPSGMAGPAECRTHPRPGRGRRTLRLLPACGGGGGECTGRGRDASCGRAHGRAGAGPRLGLAGSGRARRREAAADQQLESSTLPGEPDGATPEVNPANSERRVTHFRPRRS